MMASLSLKVKLYPYKPLNTVISSTVDLKYRSEKCTEEKKLPLLGRKKNQAKNHRLENAAKRCHRRFRQHLNTYRVQLKV